MKKDQCKKTTAYLKLNLTGKRLILRPFKFSDFKSCQASDKNRLPILNKFDEPISLGKSDYQEFKEKIKRHRLRGKARIHFIFGIFDKKTGEHIGNLDLLTINQQIGWGNLGFHIQNQYYSKGYASEASRLALTIAFKYLNFHRIEAAMEMDNLASKKVAIKIGLKYEGVRKKFFPHKGGIDMRVYATNAIDYK
ncbi:MAG: GNAT family N-acetyltransferase [Bacteriovorax sp.]|nr:GNAT family N-acetyltransferase [Bacteriovorax sp.]